MRIEKISTSELNSFLESDLYKNSINIPITPFRAISQTKNPRAEPEDIVLIIAIDKNNQIVGFIGALPDRIPNIPEVKVAWNSCWWIDQEKGKQVAFPLLSSLLTTWKFNILFRDLTEQTKQIILNLGKFEIIQQLQGHRYFIRLDSKHILPKKNINFNYLKPLLYSIDILFNLTWIGLVKIKRLFQTKNHYQVQYVKHIDNESSSFIHKLNRNELFQRSEIELSWILENPWIKEEVNALSKRYYFSDYSKSFQNYLLKITISSKIIGILYISEHNGLVQIPYAYFQQKDILIINEVIQQFLISKKAVSFHCFNKSINTAFEKQTIFWRKKITKKEFVTSTFLKNKIDVDFKLQDGDGDRVFT